MRGFFSNSKTTSKCSTGAAFHFLFKECPFLPLLAAVRGGLLHPCSLDAEQETPSIIHQKFFGHTPACRTCRRRHHHVTVICVSDTKLVSAINIWTVVTALSVRPWLHRLAWGKLLSCRHDRNDIWTRWRTAKV